ncbi:uncharacterized protein B0I36DRAFT_317707 [Microdochium trichocladiopsis]|uniref:Uncharacterized protein n=1 Tax=Microdochium trichocladiopsis TaxID=1682393 RepID=A0A9P8Y8W5_9PEZI|nr:uncharacterized protein B0I36DRAFT_317707 [Microdochium trichocladiopsis]KAH7035134.1 hypothetical protein B0I36DRAFT_317707 [Microdochium trichocladiopsis]
MAPSTIIVAKTSGTLEHAVFLKVCICACAVLARVGTMSISAHFHNVALPLHVSRV